MNAVIATSYGFREAWYRERLLPDFRLHFANGGVECVELLRSLQPEVLILETSLLWGGADGVLAIRETDRDLIRIPVLLVAVGARAGDLYRLSQYTVNDFLVRAPADAQLAYRVRALARTRGELERESLAPRS